MATAAQLKPCWLQVKTNLGQGGSTGTTSVSITGIDFLFSVYSCASHHLKWDVDSSSSSAMWLTQSRKCTNHVETMPHSVPFSLSFNTLSSHKRTEREEGEQETVSLGCPLCHFCGILSFLPLCFERNLWDMCGLYQGHSDATFIGVGKHKVVPHLIVLILCDQRVETEMPWYSYVYTVLFTEQTSVSFVSTSIMHFICQKLPVRLKGYWRLTRQCILLQKFERSHNLEDSISKHQL